MALTAPAGGAEEDPGWPALADRLATIDGLDLAFGLSVADHRPEVLRRLLTLFVEYHGDSATRLDAMLAAGDRAGLLRLAHALKGAAGHVGARTLSGLASQVQEAIRHEAPDLEAPVTSLAQALRRLLGPLQDTLGDRPGTTGPVALDQVKVVVANLKALLRAGELAAADLARSEAPLLRAVMGEERSRALACSIADFELEDALAILEDALPDDPDDQASLPH
jgi:HPt (histidine-containing phosphotransfer) domain-containing protein